MAKDRVQQNFQLGPAGLAAFEAWCTANNYDKRGVFIAGWLMLMDVAHEQRGPQFIRAKKWDAADFTMPPPKLDDLKQPMPTTAALVVKPAPEAKHAKVK